LKAKEFVRDCKNRAWATYQQPIKDQVSRVLELATALLPQLPEKAGVLEAEINKLKAEKEPMRRDVMSSLHKLIQLAGKTDHAFWLRDYYQDLKKEN
ncbi:transketolase, partial [Flavihumibacter sediminis]|nr:transketolase [Flavihumibacter sediminis]